LPWVRRGAAAQVTTVDVPASGGVRVSMPVAVQFNHLADLSGACTSFPSYPVSGAVDCCTPDLLCELVVIALRARVAVGTVSAVLTALLAACPGSPPEQPRRANATKPLGRWPREEPPIGKRSRPAFSVATLSVEKS